MVNIRASIVKIKVGDTTGTGFVASNTGLIITCAHVVESYQERTIDVFFYEHSEPYHAVIEQNYGTQNIKSDIAFLRLQENLPDECIPCFIEPSHGTKGLKAETLGFPNIKLDGMPAIVEIIDHTKTNDGQPLLIVHSSIVTEGFSGAPIWLSEQQAVIGMISSITRPDKYARMNDVVCVIPGEYISQLHPELTFNTPNPYRGLQTYTEQQANLFFGRSAYIEELRQKLCEEPRFLTVLGPIGSGKTSAIQAGLLPQIRQGIANLRSHLWLIIYVIPGVDPFLPLISAGITDQNRDLINGISQWRTQSHKHERIALYIDPLEELFNQTPIAIRKSFFDQLTVLIKNDLISLIISMNDSYYSALAEQKDFVKFIEQNISNIPQIQYQELLEVIQEPAKIAHLHFDAGLADKIADETMKSTKEPREHLQKQSSSRLALVSFCLQQIVEILDGRHITYGHLQQVGGVTGSLTIQATQAYHTLNQQQQRIARYIFLELVELGDEMTGRLDSCKRLPIKTFYHLSPNQKEVREIIEHFEKHHLLETTRDPDTNEQLIKITHEVLLRDWTLLRDWLQEDHTFLSWHTDIQSRTHKWIKSASDIDSRDSSHLLRDHSLDEAQMYVEKYGARISSIEKELITYSLTLAEIEAQQRYKAAKNEHYLKQLQKQQQTSLANHLSSEALLIQQNDPSQLHKSILLAIESLRISPNVHANSALRYGLRCLPDLHRHIRFKDTRAIFFSPNSYTFISAGRQGVQWIHQMEIEAEESTHFVSFGPKGIQMLACSTDSKYVLVGSQDRFAWLIDLSTQRTLIRFKHHVSISSIVLSSKDPCYAITGSEDCTVRIWKLSDSHQLSQGKRDTIDGTMIKSIAHQNPVTMISLSNNEQYLASATQNGNLFIWETKTWKRIDHYQHSSTIRNFTFLTDDNVLIFLDTEGNIFSWHRKARTPHIRKHIYQFPHPDKVIAFAISPGGQELATICYDNVVRIWNIKQRYERQSFRNSHTLTALSFHPRTSWLAIGDSDGLVSIWDIYQAQLLWYIPHSHKTIHTLLFNPQQNYIVTGTKNRLNFWLLKQGNDSYIPFNGHILRLFFSIDEMTIYIAQLEIEKNMILIWGYNAEIAQWKLFQEFSYQSDFTLTPNGKKAAVPLTNREKRMFSQNNCYLARTEQDRYITIQNLDTTTTTMLDAMDDIAELALSQDGQLLAVAHPDGTIMIWNWQHQLHQPYKRGIIKGAVRLLAFSQDTQQLIHINQANVITLWSWGDQHQEHVYTLAAEESSTNLIISPNGHFLLTEGEKYGLRLWTIMDELHIQPLASEGKYLTAAFSSTGTYLAIANYVHTQCIVSIWETKTNTHLSNIALNESVTHITFSLDDKYIATAGDKGIFLSIWHTEDLIPQAQTKLTENLNKEDWHRYFGNQPYRATVENLNWREQVFSLEDDED